MKRSILFLAGACLVALAFLQAKPGAKQPVEIGTVQWLRDYDLAIAESKKSGKPVFALFQEVPG